MIKFLEDYGDATVDVFNKFRSNPKLINIWDDLEDIPNIRNQMKVLEDHKKLISEINIENHIHIGDVFVNVRYNSNGLPMNIGINLTGKHNRLIDFDGYPPSAGKWAYESVEATDNLSLGYQ